MYKKINFVLWTLLFIALFLYSFTQIDLSLTFSRVSIWQGIEKSFQYIGYFNRPLSTDFYLGILIVFTLLYAWTLYLVRQKKISRKYLWTVILIGTGILVFSYNAFSYDIFNYIFDAKIITHYHQNPYVHKALDYPGDPMLSFMHWTQRTYPYGPLWLGVTVPLSFIGRNIFIVTFYLFKFLMAGSFLLSAWLIEKITSQTKSDGSLFALTFYAFNPLIIIESVVSAHNDIVMMMLALLSLYFLTQKRYFLSPIVLIASIAIKFATLLMTPIYAYAAWQLFRKGKMKWELIFMLTVLIMIPAVVLASVRTNFQPWYLLYVLPFAALVSKKYLVLIPSVAVSVIALLTYAPFLYLGNWNKPVPMILSYIDLMQVIITVVFVILFLLTFCGKQVSLKRDK